MFDSPKPSSIPPPQVLSVLPQDVTAIRELLEDSDDEREQPRSIVHRYLDDPVAKPWGVEYRIYVDPLIDVWMLHLTPGSRTSLHAHPRKSTYLLCVAGRGQVEAGDGRRVPIEPGSALLIEPGAMHRTTAATELTLVEIELPRDKLDLLRLEDVGGRAGRGYEEAGTAMRQIAPLHNVSAGIPRARLRAGCVQGHCRFDVECGLLLQQRPQGLLFAIGLDPIGVLRRDIVIARREQLGAIAPERLFLTIRPPRRSQDGDPALARAATSVARARITPRRQPAPPTPERCPAGT